MPLILVVEFVGLLLAGELGFSLGRRRSGFLDESSRSQVATVEAAILGLLALLLGFTFAMAQARFETRKVAEVDEANAIGTANLRADLLPEPQRTRVRALFRRYIDARIRFDDPDLARVHRVQEESQAIQKELWTEAMSAAHVAPEPLVVDFFVESLNSVIDLEEKRLAVLENHLPDAVIVLLAIGGFLAVVASGYGCGLSSKTRLVLPLVVVPLLIASVSGLIVDLDRPASGFIRVGQASMLRLRDSIAADVTPGGR